MQLFETRSQVFKCRLLEPSHVYIYEQYALSVDEKWQQAGTVFTHQARKAKKKMRSRFEK